MEEERPYEHLDLQNRDLQTKTKKEKDLQKMLQSDLKRYKRVGVGVGLLCAVLALLNIAVPLSLYQSNMVEREHLTEERDCLKRMICETPGWQKFDRGCYYVSTEKKTWEQSRRWCRDRQSDLIVIKSKEKQDFVASFNKRVHVGLTDRDREGSFQWVDGTPLTTPTYWKPGEPDRERSEPGKGLFPNAVEDCVEYYDGSHSSSSVRGWNDVPCSNASMHATYWLCERVVC